ncbi:hypothetical protein K435DRAFT_457105 [Dendrothele bispora CBS 962.96]|uniref:Apple domain-containing protein n=1 Tax=Dendrothele bispora (strain CBS 962.96) TaxID=1314807 RepID=A0A4S8L233_DENBC|nr:hypothetical protein K435DRAFT_457105 [Dendrothele bispora CBS 962.96]
MLFPRSCFSFLLFISTVLAALVNRTIDDTIQDSSGNSVQYSPNIPGRTAWNVGGDCDACTAGALNTSELFDKTWHDGTCTLADYSSSARFYSTTRYQEATISPMFL